MQSPRTELGITFGAAIIHSQLGFGKANPISISTSESMAGRARTEKSATAPSYSVIKKDKEKDKEKAGKDRLASQQKSPEQVWGFRILSF